MGGLHSPDACHLRRAGICDGVRDAGYSSCSPCREERRVEDAARRDDLRARRKCLTCEAPAKRERRGGQTVVLKYCAKHLAYYAARTREASAAAKE